MANHDRADRAPHPGRSVNKATRICRTPEECFQAGWDDGANDPPLTPAQLTRIAALLGPHIRASIAAEATKGIAAEDVA